ncbi:hypothetical protein IF2G_07445 [Cordyceps javanica]|nr:hypothetical protein IF2G_07445 [Cordyceps javanica]
MRPHFFPLPFLSFAVIWTSPSDRGETMEMGGGLPPPNVQMVQAPEKAVESHIQLLYLVLAALHPKLSNAHGATLYGRSPDWPITPSSPP